MEDEILFNDDNSDLSFAIEAKEYFEKYYKEKVCFTEVLTYKGIIIFENKRNYYTLYKSPSCIHFSWMGNMEGYGCPYQPDEYSNNDDLFKAIHEKMKKEKHILEAQIKDEQTSIFDFL